MRDAIIEFAMAFDLAIVKVYFEKKEHLKLDKSGLT